MNREELMKKLELARVGNGTQTYNDVVLTLTKEETIELLKYIEKFEKLEKLVWKKVEELVNEEHRSKELYDKNIELKQENQELEEKVDYYKKEMESEQCFRETTQECLVNVIQAIKILKQYVDISMRRNEVNGNYDIHCIYSFGSYKDITEEKYDLLKEVFESVGEE